MSNHEPQPEPPAPEPERGPQWEVAVECALSIKEEAWILMFYADKRDFGGARNQIAILRADLARAEKALAGRVPEGG